MRSIFTTKRKFVEKYMNNQCPKAQVCILFGSWALGILVQRLKQKTQNREKEEWRETLFGAPRCIFGVFSFLFHQTTLRLPCFVKLSLLVLGWYKHCSSNLWRQTEYLWLVAVKRSFLRCMLIKWVLSYFPIFIQPNKVLLLIVCTLITDRLLYNSNLASYRIFKENRYKTVIS